jgi:hypothetical protein
MKVFIRLLLFKVFRIFSIQGSYISWQYRRRRPFAASCPLCACTSPCCLSFLLAAFAQIQAMTTDSLVLVIIISPSFASEFLPVNIFSKPGRYTNARDARVLGVVASALPAPYRKDSLNRRVER